MSANQSDYTLQVITRLGSTGRHGSVHGQFRAGITCALFGNVQIQDRIFACGTMASAQGVIAVRIKAVVMLLAASQKQRDSLLSAPVRILDWTTTGGMTRFRYWGGNSFAIVKYPLKRGWTEMSKHWKNLGRLRA